MLSDFAGKKWKKTGRRFKKRQVQSIIIQENLCKFCESTHTYMYASLYIFVYHQVALTARIYLTLHPSSLSLFTLDRSSQLHPVSAQSWCKWVLARWPTLTHACVGVCRRTSLMSSTFLLQQCPYIYKDYVQRIYIYIYIYTNILCIFLYIGASKSP